MNQFNLQKITWKEDAQRNSLNVESIQKVMHWDHADKKAWYQICVLV